MGSRYASRRRGLDLGRRIYESSILDLEKDECLALAYYIFEISKTNHNVDYDDNGTFSLIIHLLSKSLGLENRLKDVYNSYLDFFVKEGLIHLIDKNDSAEGEKKSGDENLSRYQRDYEERMYRRRQSFNFEEDEGILREVDLEGTCDEVKDYLRILYCGKNPIYSQLIYYIFFSSAKVNVKKFNSQIPSRFLNKVKSLSKVKFLQKELGLSDIEIGYILVRYRKGCIELLEDAFNAMTKNSFELYTKLLGITKSEFTKITRSDGKLRQFGFIDDERRLNPAVIECIESQDLSLYFSECIKPIDLTETYGINSFCVPEKNSDIYKNLLKSESPVSVLLYGEPGSGKTEYAKALVKSSGKKALIFKNEAESENKDVLGTLTCLLSLNRKDTVLIIDEADTLLATTIFTFLGPIQSSKSKGAVNKMMECSQNKVIWIVNHKSQIDESTLRRFTVSYKFEAMSPLMLEEIAHKKLNSIDVSDEAKKNILKMFSQYKVTGSSVDNMIKTINSMNINDEEKLVQSVGIVLKDNALLLHGKSQMREMVNPGYDVSVLNTSIPSEKICRMLTNAKKFADKNPGSGAIRMLFYGLSGTGKTEFARYISQMLGKNILLKRASDIFDKYVGGTEENIASAFSEAAANDMILLFDEADSFFSDRNNASRNFERTQVNEFLTQLEEFPGIVICTTNLRNIMDPAMLRRFHITVDFKALTKDGIKTLLKKYFSDFDFTEEMIKEVSSYDSVTPGDFGRLCGSIRFMDEDEISAEYIIEELCNIQKEKNESGCGVSSKKIGFCA